MRPPLAHRGGPPMIACMTPTKLLIGQILVVFAIVLVGLWAATQWAAAQLGFQPELGAPWFKLAGLPFYRPWALFGWWYHYEAYAPRVFNRAGDILYPSSQRTGERCASLGSYRRSLPRTHGPRILGFCSLPARAGRTRTAISVLISPLPFEIG